MPFGTFGTAGDAGIEAEAPAFDELLGELALGLYRLSCPAEVRPLEERAVALKAESRQALLVGFLNERVYLIDTAGFITFAVKVSVSGAEGAWELKAALLGEADAFRAHPRGLLVKAATYHKLELAQSPSAWRARVILDI